MTAAQKKLRTLRDRQSRERGKMAELGLADELTDETRAELDGIEAGTADLERQLRAAQVAVDEEDRSSIIETGTPTGDAEQRERVQLRSRVSVGRYLSAALKGRAPDGAEAELQQAASVDGIPIELWERPAEQRQEDRAITAAPSTGTGVNLEPLIPQVFSPSIAARMNIDMPQVASGTFSTARVVHGTDPAAAVAKSAVVPEVASTWEVKTTTPHRVGGALRLTLEDIATVGHAGFESMLRQHISRVRVSYGIDSRGFVH